MNQTRLFLIFAWLMVATLLWMEWGKEKAAPATPAVATETSSAVPAASGVPPNAPATVPSAPGSPVPPGTASSDAKAATVTVTTDVLRVVLDGGELREADLLKYPSQADANSPPVRLLTDDATNYFVAQSGWVSSSSAAPSHQGAFVPAGAGRDFKLADGTRELVVPFVWTGANGVTIRRGYVFQRGS